MIHLKKTLLSLSTALLVGLPSHAARTTDPIPPEPPWILKPLYAPSDSAFDLSLSSYRYNCATRFEKLQVSAKDGRINLYFSTYQDPLVLCTMEYRPYGTTFRVPGLKAGDYKVYALPQGKEEFAGTLKIGIDPPITYGIKPQRVPADREFELKLWSDIFSCVDTFSLKSSRIGPGGDITLTFLDGHDPKVAASVKCNMNFGPWGPTFKMAALPMGNYAVYAERLPACAPQGCKMAPTRQFADTLRVTSPQTSEWFVEPSRVPAGRKFTFKVLNHGLGNCQTSFSNQSLHVSNGVIVAGFAVEHHPERVCVTDIRPHGPTFDAPALKAGRYPVYVDAYPPCQFREPRCVVDFIAYPYRTPDDTLVVEPAENPKSGWFVSPREVPADQSFALSILDSAYGNCQTSFSHESIMVTGGSIRASFVIENHPERVCVTDIRPHGPTFKMDGLKAGKYPVYVSTLPACLFQNPACAIVPVPDTLRLPDDTLYVSGTSAVLLDSKASLAPRGAFSLGAINLALPQGTRGTWKAELTTLSGRSLGQAALVSVTDGAGTARYPLPLGTQRGIYLLRLTSPDKETHTLRIPVGE